MSAEETPPAANPPGSVILDEATPATGHPLADPYVWSAVKTADGGITLAGNLPAESLRQDLVMRAGEAAADTTQLASGAPEGFDRDARAAVDALALLSQGSVTYDGTRWIIEGTPAPDADEETLLAALEPAATPQDQWQLRLPETPPASSEGRDIAARVEAEILADQPGSPEPAATTAAVAEPPAQAPAAEPTTTPGPNVPAICEQHLADFSARNAILFQSGSARISPESQTALRELAGFIAECAQAPIYIEGHTDADGGEAANLALSVARAEAVAQALVELGVSPLRLYAVGYGESAPIASNDTAEGKRLNRRIVVTLDGAE